MKTVLTQIADRLQDMNVWIMQTGEPIHIDNENFRPMRAINLTNALISQGHKVTIWSSDFNHFTKQHRYGCESSIRISENLTINLIFSRGYSKHIGLSRLIDHFQLGFNLLRNLRRQDLPQVAFVGFPPIEPAWVMAIWLKRNRVPFVLDVKDAWPENLVAPFPEPLNLLVRIILSPYFLMRNMAFKSATGLTSVTQEFLDWTLVRAGRIENTNDSVFPLTTSQSIHTERIISDALTWWDALKIPNRELIRGYFVGSLSDAFDFGPIIDVAKKFSVTFIIAGDGPRFQELKTATEDIPSVLLTGKINTAQASVLAANSDFAIAPLAERIDFQMSIPNKFYDAMQSGKPILTSLTGPAKNLLESYNIGMYYCGKEDLLNKIEALVRDPKQLEEMSDNAKTTFENHFNFEMVYMNFAQKLTQLPELE
jgi:glycosyltransferase involved in cell wall biosynthesis